jgi:plasmid stabilization system protein ParE
VAGGADKPRFELHPEAEAEIVAGGLFYDERRVGLGDEFLDEIQRLIDFALGNPEAGAPLVGGFRWVLSRRFPYAVVYRHRPDGLLQIIAVAHLRRRPG